MQITEGMPIIADKWPGKVANVGEAIVSCLTDDGTSYRVYARSRVALVDGNLVVSNPKRATVTCGRRPVAVCGMKEPIECSTHGGRAARERAAMARQWSRAVIQ
jgi:hypothetical protein